MYGQSIIKNIFSIINILLITYLLIDRKTVKVTERKIGIPMFCVLEVYFWCE